MIIVKITGGLGNQLFKLNKVLDLNLINKNVYLDLNHYEFDRYKRIYRLKTKFTQNKNISKLFKNTLFRINKITVKLRLFKFYDEKVNDLTESNINEKILIKYLSGSWEENVIPSEDNLKTFYSMFEEKENKSTNVVAVHFRTKNYSIKLDDEYYLKALKYFGKDYSFHIYGDDIDYLKMKTPSLFKNYNFKIIEIKDEIEAFEELKTYRNYISSNSTFCWWAIILNSKEPDKVIGPKLWMNQSYQLFRPASWQLIPNKIDPTSKPL